MRGFYRAVKRFLDVTASFLGLVLLSPLLLAVSILIKIDSRGPVIFRQKRIGRNGKVFEIYKFRSMCVGAEKTGSGVYSGKGDARVTRIGKILRATSIDELPQLLNIIKGDMSLVGPRPERPEIAKEYEKEIPEFAFRLKVKAGLTGYAQIYGKYNTTFYDKLKMDLMYIRNYSLLLDLKLILMTPKILLMKESTEGVADEKEDPNSACS